MRLLLLVLALATAAPALAQTQLEMNQRADAAWRAADAEMNRQWRATNESMKRLDASDTSRGGGLGYAAALLGSQRAWLQFRDRQCVIEAGQYAGGSMQPMTRAQCLARLTRERTVQLKALLWER